MQELILVQDRNYRKGFVIAKNSIAYVVFDGEISFIPVHEGLEILDKIEIEVGLGCGGCDFLDADSLFCRKYALSSAGVSLSGVEKRTRVPNEIYPRCKQI